MKSVFLYHFLLFIVTLLISVPMGISIAKFGNDWCLPFLIGLVFGLICQALSRKLKQISLKT